MTLSRLGKKLITFTGTLLGFLVIFLVAFHIWFVRHAKDLLEETVEKRSDGKVKLKVEKLRYNYFSRKMVIREAVFFTTDTLTAPTAYRFAVKEIQLRLKGLLPLVIDNKLLIDSLHLQSPDIWVTTLRLAKEKPGKKSKDVSIPYEMGKIYHSIQDALEVLKVTKFQIDNGKFTLLNKAQPGQVPLRVSNISILIDNLKVDTSQLSGREKLLFSDNVVIRSDHQDILFPDGRHRLAFSGFRINLQNQLVEFDSCTIAATRTDSSLSSFNVFFDTLRLTRIDFDTLYRSEVIKADSVYCLNPKFELVAEAGKKKTGKKGIPRLENIVQQLTGNLLLGFVGVENADFNIRITKDGVPNTYTFSRNNFQMQGLSIVQDAAKPITVESFDMAIRNYENFIKDSSYSIQFDSIRFRDDQIYLSNFLFNKLDRGRILNSFRMPRFQLDGLSWDDLVFDRKLRARTAIMYEPDIDYSPSPNPVKKQTLFQSLGAVNEYMDLDKLDIINGRIDLKLKNDLRIQLEKASLSVQSQSLLSSTRLAGIKNSLNSLYFETGKIQAGNTYLLLNRIRYTGESGKFAAGSIGLNNETKKMEALLENVTVEKMVVDESNGNLFAEGINWGKGDIEFTLARIGQSKTKPGSIIELKKLQGSNTRFGGTISSYHISTKLDEVKLDELISHPGEKIILTGFAAKGNDFRMADKGLELSAEEYHFTDQALSVFKKVLYRNEKTSSKTNISINEITAIPKLLRLINGEVAIDAVNVSDPVIDWENDVTGSATTNVRPHFPVVDISSIKITSPVIHYKKKYDKGTVSLYWNGKKEPGELILEELINKTAGNTKISAKKIGLRMADVQYIGKKGRTFQSNNAKIQGVFNDILLEQSAGSRLSWKAVANTIAIRDFLFDSTGKNGGKLELASAKIGDLRISSETVGNVEDLFAANEKFLLENLTGRFTNTQSRFTWNNASYDRSNGMLAADSVSYRPLPDKDSFIATRQFQTDYIQAGTGLVKIGPLDLNALIGDRILLAGSAEIHDAYFYDYKDKRLPFKAGIIKPLPVQLLKKIPLKIRLDTIRFINGHVRYTELNDKTKKEGSIPVTRMSVSLQNVKNFNLSLTDSLAIQAEGFLFDVYNTRLLVKESYADSSGGFLMTLQIGPGDLSVLNSTLVPLASVKLLSGKMDTLAMQVTGRDYLARGVMNLYYEDLKVQLLKEGDENKRTLKTRLLSFLANSFIVRSKNRSKSANVFFFRNRERSAINYLLNITLSGIMESTGIRSNKKLLRRHRNASGEKKSSGKGSE